MPRGRRPIGPPCVPERGVPPRRFWSYCRSISDQFPDAQGGLTNSDMTTYGAEDMEDLVSILGALDCVEGTDLREPWERAGGAWAGARTAPRRRLGDISADEVPSHRACSSCSTIIGRSSSEWAWKRGLRGRIQQHRATGTDLSSSTLRASVAVEVLRVS